MSRAATALSLEQLAEHIRPVTLPRDRRLPVLEPVEALLPRGLPRGKAVAVSAAPGVSEATTLALSLAAGAAGRGWWIAVVGREDLGLVAAAELGIPFDRLVLVPRPGPKTAEVIAAFADGFDVVFVDSRLALSQRDTRRLLVRIRERGTVMIVTGGQLQDGGASVRLRVVSSEWEGIGTIGRLRARRAVVEADGRGPESQFRRVELWLPGADGTIAPIDRPPSVWPAKRPASGWWSRSTDGSATVTPSSRPVIG